MHAIHLKEISFSNFLGKLHAEGEFAGTHLDVTWLKFGHSVLHIKIFLVFVDFGSNDSALISNQAQS